MTPLRAWTAIFALWSLFLSGAFASFLGSPGVFQLLRLQSLLNSKQAQVSKLQSEIVALQLEGSLLEHNQVAQQREIRRVLGYAAADELIFDFSSGEFPSTHSR